MAAGTKGEEMGKGITRYENHLALECLLGSILFQELSLNQDHQTKAAVVALAHSPKQLPWLETQGERNPLPGKQGISPRQDKHLNIGTAMVLPSVSEEPAESFGSPHTPSELNTTVPMTPVSLNPSNPESSSNVLLSPSA